MNGAGARTVAVGGAKIHLVDRGEGPAALFLHGNPDSSDLWRDVIRWVRPSAPPAIGRARPAARPTLEAPTIVAVASAGQLAIEFAALQSAGEILVTLGSDTRVTVSASGPVPYTVSQGAIALDNAGSQASYRIALPAAAEWVTIRVGGRPVFDKRRATIVTNASRDSAGRYRIALDRGEPGP